MLSPISILHSEFEAKQCKNCQMNPESCSCQDKTTKMECDCLNGKIWEIVLIDGAFLPQINNGRLTKVEDGELILKP
jgi:plasmid rolling circle replication initiator protein Rep